MAETATREKMAEPVKIRFPVPVLERLESIAQERDSTVNAVVRRLVNEGLERKNGGNPA